MIKITLGLCTCNRPKELKDALRSLLIQKISDPEKYQIRIVVADNAPEGSQTTQIIEELKAEYQTYPIALINEPVRGISSARNCVVREALSDDALLFIDDDEEALEGWLQAMLSYWEESKADIIVGPIEHRFLEKLKYQWMYHVPTFQKKVGKTGDQLNTGYTSNILISRRVFDLVPEFDLRFSLTGGEDSDFVQRAFRKGFNIKWCNEATVSEVMHPSRATIKWITMRSMRYGINLAFQMRNYNEPRFFLFIKMIFSALKRLSLLLLGIITNNPKLIGNNISPLCHRLGFILGVFKFEYEEYSERKSNPK